ncbi:transposase [Actinomyces naeslundii]|uniref:transposase n=1 Tax=Actinomyces naeslundii TaxID=1655 RepID=UPI000A85D315|nr:transposase [Actinomyces naeslundii]
MSISRVAAALTVAWYAANTAVLTRAEQVLNEASDRFEGVEVLGVDDSTARVAPVREVPPLSDATPSGATSTPAVVIDLTPVRQHTGPARMLDVAPGRSRKVLRTWLAQRDQTWREQVEVVATGRVHRVQERHRRGAARGAGGYGLVPRRVPGCQQA